MLSRYRYLATLAATTTVGAAGLVFTAFGAAERAQAETSAARVVVEQAAGTTVAAYADRVLYSAWDSSTLQYHLTELTVGGPRRLPVPPSKVAFDVSVGPDADGRALAVYSRCSGYGPQARPPVAPVRHLVARGCRLRSLRLATGARERLLDSTHVPGGSEFQPAQWRGRIAFFRLFPARRGSKQSVVPSLEVQGRGPRRSYVTGPSGESADGRSAGQGPSGLALVGTAMQWTWSYIASFTDCPGGSLQAQPGLLRAVDPGRTRARTVFGGCGRAQPDIGAAALAPGTRAFTRVAAAGAPTIRVQRLDGRILRDVPLATLGVPNEAAVLSLALTSDTLVAVVRPDIQRLDVRIIEAPLH